MTGGQICSLLLQEMISRLSPSQELWPTSHPVETPVVHQYPLQTPLIHPLSLCSPSGVISLYTPEHFVPLMSWSVLCAGLFIVTSQFVFSPLNFKLPKGGKRAAISLPPWKESALYNGSIKKILFSTQGRFLS